MRTFVSDIPFDAGKVAVGSVCATAVNAGQRGLTMLDEEHFDISFLLGHHFSEVDVSEGT